MEKTFLITIDCSEIQKSHTIYIMYIDKTKMTIVYELIEWIRWIFSIEGCFCLTHENTIIHELEDIQILSKLKNLKLKTCNQSQCLHTKFYRTLLKKLNFFVEWNDVKVPKYFLEKIKHLEGKLTEENLRDLSGKAFENNSKYCKITEISNEKESCVKKNLFLEKPPISKEAKYDKLNKTPTLDNVQHCSEIYQETDFYFSNEGNKVSCDIKEASNYKQNIKNSLEKSSPPFSEKNLEMTEIDYHSNTNKKLNLQEGKKNCKSTSEINEKKKSNYLKPFSVGEILSNIRSEEKKLLIRSPENNASPYENFTFFENKDRNLKQPLNGNSYEDWEVLKTNTGKKRKRIRRSRKSKEKFFKSDNQANYKEIYLNSNKTEIVKPCHIRFENELSEEEEENIEVNITQDDEKLTNLSFNTNKVCGGSMKSELNDNKTNVEELMSFINHKREAIASSMLNENEKNSKLKMEPSISKDQIGAREENFNSFNSEVLGASSPGFKDNELVNSNNSALMHLKEKFLSPAVIQRFY